MNSYVLIGISIIFVMIVLIIATFMIAIIKGVRAGKTEIEVKIIGIISVTINLTDVSKN